MYKNVIGRRTALRSIVASAAGLLLPGLMGCEQKTPDTGQAAPEPSPQPPAAQPPETGPAMEGDGAMTPAKPSGGTMTKADAEYQEMPNGEENCANCQLFVAESNTCRVVEGDISPQGWCKLWVAKVS